MTALRAFTRGTILLAAAALLAGCAGPELTNMWRNPAFPEAPLTKVFVISVSKDAVHRRLWEDAFSAELALHGVAATPSYQLFPDGVPDTAESISAVKANAFDGVLVTRRLAPEVRPVRLEGYVTRQEDLRFDQRQDRFVSYYREVQHAAVVDSQKVFLRAIDLWSTSGSGVLVWSATSRTPEASSTQSVRPDIIDLVLSELTDKAVIPPKR
jgi:hypothetical protein